MRTLINAAVLTLPAVLAACDGKNAAVFATGTDIGIQADARLQTASIGYDRIEAFVGPVFTATGTAPPIVGFMGSNLELFTPKVKQLYATGKAAELVTQIPPPDKNPEQATMSGDRKVMAFGTTTHIGASLGFSAGQPDHISFGFKRREASVIPILPATKDSGASTDNQYASTLASIDMDLQAGKFVETGLKVTQFIATGTAARNLAKSDEIRQIFRQKSAAALSVAEQEGKAVVASTSDVATCIQIGSGPLSPEAKARWTKAVDAGIAAGVFPAAARDRHISATTRDEVLNILSGRIASKAEMDRFKDRWDQSQGGCDKKIA